MVMEQTGISLSEHKRELVYGRLTKRLRTLGLGTFADYCSHLTDDNNGELLELINAITTNLTSFFRENHHFEYLEQTVFPELIASRNNNRRIRIWSAGCSTGEEPYSIAMMVRECFPSGQGWDVKILATDIDSNVLAKAAAGVYAEDRVSGLPTQRVKKWFRKGSGEQAGTVKVSPELQSLISFKQLNLMNPWPMKGPFDIIFCRNVVIYFDKPTQKVLFGRYADLMADDGHLFVGHSETLFKVTERFRLVGRTIYKKA
jgi:chemotaxis protein methyltransferase CheR